MNDDRIDIEAIKFKAIVEINSVIAADVSVINIINNARFLREYIVYLDKLLNMNEDDLNYLLNFLDEVNDISTKLHYAFRNVIDTLNKEYDNAINRKDDKTADYIM